MMDSLPHIPELGGDQRRANSCPYCLAKAGYLQYQQPTPVQNKEAPVMSPAMSPPAALPVPYQSDAALSVREAQSHRHRCLHNASALLDLVAVRPGMFLLRCVPSTDQTFSANLGPASMAPFGAGGATQSAKTLRCARDCVPVHHKVHGLKGLISTAGLRLIGRRVLRQTGLARVTDLRPVERHDTVNVIIRICG